MLRPVIRLIKDAFLGLLIATSLFGCAKSDFTLACDALDEMQEEYVENMFFSSTDGKPTFAFETAYEKAKAHAAKAAKGADKGTRADKLNYMVKGIEGHLGYINNNGAAGTIVATAWTDEASELCHGPAS